MAHRVVTANTTRLRIVNFGVRAFDSLHNFLVTFPAGLFSYCTTTRRDVNVVFKPAGCEVVGMPETVLRFSVILGDEAGRRMAIIAHGNCSMA